MSDKQRRAAWAKPKRDKLRTAQSTSGGEAGRITLTVTGRAYALAMTLYDAGAGIADVPVTKEMIGPALAELVAKRVVTRSGITYGRYGKPGVIRIVVARQQLVAVANRAPRKLPATATQLSIPLTGAPESPALTIAELETFIEEFRAAQSPLLAERSRAIGARIAHLQQHLAVAVGDDFRNTMVMANAALRELDDVAHAVNRDVLAGLKPDAGSPLFPVWQAMATP